MKLTLRIPPLLLFVVIVLAMWLGRGEGRAAPLWLVLVAAPASLAGWGAAFALFRLFDIVKPWPISWLDARVPGGIGVMLDDLLAALYAILGLFLLGNFSPAVF